MPVVVRHWKFRHSVSPREPWHVEGDSQIVVAAPLPGQSAVVPQHTPSLQQKPLSQCPEAQSESSSHAMPFGWSGTQVPLSQCALAMQYASSSVPDGAQVTAHVFPASPPSTQVKRPHGVTVPALHIASTQSAPATAS